MGYVEDFRWEKLGLENDYYVYCSVCGAWNPHKHPNTADDFIGGACSCVAIMCLIPPLTPIGLALIVLQALLTPPPCVKFSCQECGHTWIFPDALTSSFKHTLDDALRVKAWNWEGRDLGM